MKYKDTVLLRLLPSFQEMSHLVSAIDGCQDIETQSLVTTGFLKQKHDDEFLQIWYEKKQEHFLHSIGNCKGDTAKDIIKIKLPYTFIGDLK